MCLILLMSLRLPAVRADRTLSITVCGVFLITRYSSAMFSSAVCSNQTRNIKGFTPGNKYMHSLKAKQHLLFQMNTVQKSYGEDNVDVQRITFDGPKLWIVHLSDLLIPFFLTAALLILVCDSQKASCDTILQAKINSFSCLESVIGSSTYFPLQLIVCGTFTFMILL